MLASSAPNVMECGERAKPKCCPCSRRGRGIAYRGPRPAWCTGWRRSFSPCTPAWPLQGLTTTRCCVELALASREHERARDRKHARACRRTPSESTPASNASDKRRSRRRDPSVAAHGPRSRSQQTTGAGERAARCCRRAPSVAPRVKLGSVRIWSTGRGTQTLSSQRGYTGPGRTFRCRVASLWAAP